MDTWVIVLIVLGIAVILYLFYQKQAAKAAAVAKANKKSGDTILSALGNVPVYGSAVKAYTAVAKPVNKALNTVNVDITKGLQHIPVAGKYLAMPNQVAGAAVKKVTSFLGL